jgi:hypothetical protein
MSRRRASATEAAELRLEPVADAEIERAAEATLPPAAARQPAKAALLPRRAGAGQRANARAQRRTITPERSAAL